MPKPVRQPINRDKYVGGRCSSILDAKLDNARKVGVKLTLIKPILNTWGYVLRYRSPRRYPHLVLILKYDKLENSRLKKFFKLKRSALRKADAIKGAANHRRYESMYPMKRKDNDF